MECGTFLAKSTSSSRSWEQLWGNIYLSGVLGATAAPLVVDCCNFHVILTSHHLHTNTNKYVNYFVRYIEFSDLLAEIFTGLFAEIYSITDWQRYLESGGRDLEFGCLRPLDRDIQRSVGSPEDE